MESETQGRSPALVTGTDGRRKPKEAAAAWDCFFFVLLDEIQHQAGRVSPCRGMAAESHAWDVQGEQCQARQGRGKTQALSRLKAQSSLSPLHWAHMPRHSLCLRGKGKETSANAASFACDSCGSQARQGYPPPLIHLHPQPWQEGVVVPRSSSSMKQQEYEG